jgi:Xaa-Pro dipeptidase
MYDSDTELLFRQDSWFNYVFGVTESDCYGALDIATGRSTIFIPRLPSEYQVIMGSIHPPERFEQLYGVDAVSYTDCLFSWLEEHHSDACLYLLEGQNTDSKTIPTSINFKEENDYRPEKKHQKIYASLVEIYGSERVNMKDFFHVCCTARVTKSEYEKQLMWYTAHVASRAHVAVMRSIAPHQMEYELEAKFLYEIYKHGGCRRAAYICICGTGTNSAVLHYGHAGAPNDRQLLPGDMALLDMGGEYHGYVSDITCSYPVDGKFTEKQKAVYQGVLNAQIKVLTMFKVGVSYRDCHLAAEREILKQLIRIGIVVGGSVDDDQFLDELARVRLGATFFPHGLGHMIGCDTHDVAGYAEGTIPRSPEPGLVKLRTARYLEAGMILTVEPGCYFIPYLVDLALASDVLSKYLDRDVLNEYRNFGGIRLEDVVSVSPEGSPPDNLTTCPRLVEEVESVMSGGPWPPAVDAAPYLHRKWGELEVGGRAMKEIKL